MSQTLSSAIAAAVTFKTQKNVLQNLRSDLFFANPDMAESGEFDAGHDTLLFTNVPDLAVNTTPLTEGDAPTPKALTMGTVTVDTEQYGDVVSITDVAKVKSPVELVSIGTERLSRQSRESIDQITRDVIAGGGTAVYSATNTSRSDIASGDKATVADLNKLAWRMFKAGIPRFSDGFYHLAVSAEVAYDLSQDTDFQNANTYVNVDRLLRAEVGTIAGFRVQEVVNAPTFSSTVTVHASIAMGAIKGWGAGELQTLETAHIPPGGDHSDPLGQEELLGWKVNFGVAVLSNSYYMRYESSASDLS